ncbi:MAG: zinc ribbon domain-containing protein [Chloroflexota bacterium]|nr:MAG: zinc ribbon domain-containing protein [Chloroflexota bacterium]
MIVSIIAVAMAAVVFAMVGYPLLNNRRQPAVIQPEAYQLALEDLVVEREETYAAIKELDFDHEMGNLADADYQQLRERYRRRAAGILEELDRMQAVSAAHASKSRSATNRKPLPSSEDEIEREVRRRRARRRPSPDVGTTCPSCGGSLALEDRFCAACGTAVGRQRCPECGTDYGPDDLFCGSCGASLAAGVAR